MRRARGESGNRVAYDLWFADREHVVLARPEPGKGEEEHRSEEGNLHRGRLRRSHGGRSFVFEEVEQREVSEAGRRRASTSERSLSIAASLTSVVSRPTETRAFAAQFKQGSLRGGLSKSKTHKAISTLREGARVGTKKACTLMYNIC